MAEQVKVAAIDDYWTDQISLEKNSEDAKLIPANSDGNHMAYTLKFGKKDAMYISVIQQLITRIEALEDA
jgi:glucose/arabinose dehydrogenase